MVTAPARWSRGHPPPPVRRPAPADRPVPVQGTFDELGSPLSQVTFVVVDLETTGGSHLTDAITEIGAVKVRGGEVVGELQTLVDPERGLPPFITVLTGITSAMLVGAPRAAEVVPAFLEFSRGCVLVAHNAPFDTGFLRSAAERLGLDWPAYDVLDTARLARRVLTRDEAPDCKLSTLARVLRTPTTPTHRALDDARTTVEVLHTLLERVGGLGVHSLEELTSFSAQVPEHVRRKRHLADGLPHAPGVYLFRDARSRPLYVGTSHDVRTRVRSYFTASESRHRMTEMVGLAERVDVVVCATGLEAQVRELRLIAEHTPRYNRRSTRPATHSWLALTTEPFPRLTATRRPGGAGPWLGPFTTAIERELARAALHEAFQVRQCTPRLARRSRSTACILAGMGRCGAPCDGGETVEEYAEHVAAVRAAVAGDVGSVVEALLMRVTQLAADERFEDAAVHRDRLRAFLRAAARAQRAAGLVAIEEMVAARPAAGGGWELHVVRRGRLVGAAVAPRGAAPRPYVDALLAAAEPAPGSPAGPVAPGAVGPAPAALPEETRLVLRWLELPGVRLVEVSQPWRSPVGGAAGQGSWLAPAPRLPGGDGRYLRPRGPAEARLR